MKLFSIHDKAAEAYQNPLCYRTAGEAMRAFEAAVKAPDSGLNMSPADYTLVQLGDFDVLTGTIIPLEKPLILDNAASHVKLS